MFRLNLVTPEKKIVTDLEIDEVTVSGFKGEMNILPGHAPLVSTLATGVLSFKPKGDGEAQTAAMSWGYLEVYEGGVNILAETAELPEEIDLDRCSLAEKKATSELDKSDLAQELISKYHNKLERARVRKAIAKK